MPHAVIEYSNNLEPEIHRIDTVDVIHGTMMDSGLFDLNAIKTRSIGFDNWMVGEKGQDGTFVHVRISMMTGRTVEQRQVLSEMLLNAMVTALNELPVDQLTVEICEMERATYRKA